MKNAILLGAGSSLPACFPSTTDLTDLILWGERVERNSDGTYQLSNLRESSAAVKLVICATRRFHSVAGRYFSKLGEGPANYEHLFYLAKQVLDEESGEVDNPAIGNFVAQLKTDLTPLIEEAEGSGPFLPNSFQELCREVCHYIADLVWRRLQRKPSKRNHHLLPFVEALKTGRVAGISTLCHDTHVETHLTQEGIPLSDGFSAPQSGYRYWKNDFSSEHTIPFVKLHGSVDWWTLSGSEVCIPPTGHYQQRLRHEDGTRGYASKGRPELIIGTFNKFEEYSQGMFLDLYYRFRAMLKEVDQLAICGYSFGDKGINGLILEWFYAEPDRRRFLIFIPIPIGSSGTRAARYEGVGRRPRSLQTKCPSRKPLLLYLSGFKKLHPRNSWLAFEYDELRSAVGKSSLYLALHGIRSNT